MQFLLDSSCRATVIGWKAFGSLALGKTSMFRGPFASPRPTSFGISHQSIIGREGFRVGLRNWSARPTPRARTRHTVHLAGLERSPKFKPCMRETLKRIVRTGDGSRSTVPPGALYLVMVLRYELSATSNNTSLDCECEITVRTDGQPGSTDAGALN